MKIPKSFELFGSTITVKFDDDKCNENSAYGIGMYKGNTILLRKKAHGADIEKTEIECSFLHEIIHFIVDRLAYDDLNNEEFVTRFSSALHQCLTTQKY